MIPYCPGGPMSCQSTPGLSCLRSFHIDIHTSIGLGVWLLT
ncbi:unnamed protein product [Staurois parvus]|uniref:Uncharacterized protein n=1 Tax=Staurois parvus TaxID=386267 RepID=A0ABN9HMS3_9NEOB|nr:unnamed protein product [Staurois parvus]